MSISNDRIRDLLTRELLKFHGSYTVTDGCWEWNGTLSTDGYGVLVSSRSSRTINLKAHRIAFFLTTKLLPPCLDHLCRNRKCVNPAHLEAVDLATNTMRGMAPPAMFARATHCIRGHELRYAKNGQRRCKTCMNLRQRKYRAARRATPVRQIELRKVMPPEFQIQRGDIQL